MFIIKFEFHFEFWLKLNLKCTIFLLCVFTILPNIPHLYEQQFKKQAMKGISNVPVIWVLGGPGSGKGTQCDKIVAKYGFTHLSTGDLLRAEVESGSERGKDLTAIMESGKLVPMGIVLDLLREAMAKALPTSSGFLIDGYPREKGQGIAFEKEITPVNTVLYFECSPETLTTRLLGRAETSGRADDNETTIKLRLKTFMENNDGVLSLCPEKTLRVNAERTVDQIFEEVEAHLDKLILSFQITKT